MNKQMDGNTPTKDTSSVKGSSPAKGDPPVNNGGAGEDQSSLKGFLKKGVSGDPYRRAAKLLLLLGKEQAAEILRHFDQEEIEKITHQIAGIKRIEKPEAELILQEFGRAEKQISAGKGGADVARQMLIRAFGEERGTQIVSKVIPFGGEQPFSFLEEIDGSQLFMLLRKESPAVIAIVMSYLSKKKSGEIIKSLSADLQVETLRRIGRMKEVSPSVVASIETKLRERLHRQGVQVTEDVDGKERLAAILKHMDIRKGEELLQDLDPSEGGIGKEVSEKLFTTADIVRIEDTDLQRVLRDYDEGELARILKGCSEEIEDKLLSNISDRRRELVKSERDFLGPMRRSEVDQFVGDFLHYLREEINRGDVRLSNPDNPYV